MPQATKYTWYLTFVTHFFIKTPILPPIFANQPSNHWHFWYFSDHSCLWGHIWQKNKTVIMQEWHWWRKKWLKVPWNSNVGLSLHCVINLFPMSSGVSERASKWTSGGASTQHVDFIHLLPTVRLSVHNPWRPERAFYEATDTDFPCHIRLPLHWKEMLSLLSRG